MALSRINSRDLFNAHVSRFFDDLERDFFGDDFMRSALAPFRESKTESAVAPLWSARNMPMDIRETDTQYDVSVELPGVSKDGINVDVADGVLRVSAEKQQEHREETDKFHRVERSYGRMQRSLRLPDNVDQDRVQATYTDGVLQITLPKTEPAEPRAKRVPVN